MQQKKKIKVLEAIRQGQIGGGETHILNLVVTLDTTKFEPVVLSFTDGQMMDTLNEIGVKNFIIPSNKAFDVLTWKKVKQLLQEEKIDIIHVHGTRANTNIFWAAKSLGVPIIYTIHGWSFHDDQNWAVKNARIFVEKFITQNSKFNISVSESNQKTGFENISNFKSVVINNGINLNVFNPNKSLKNIREELKISQEKIVVGFVARMTAQKDPLTLIHAFKKVLQQKNNVVLLMVGDGELKEKVIQLANELKINEQIIFENFRNDIPDVLNAIDIFCLPSLWEGLPIGLLEAMTMKKAVIATEVDGSKEIINHQENGLIIQPQNVDELANAILMLAENFSLRNELGNSARKTVEENFDIKKMTKQIEQLYLNTLNLN
ncbi:MAG: glycosyltransferase family 4 protein [Chitinophagaceae bacterium]